MSSYITKSEERRLKEIGTTRLEKIGVSPKPIIPEPRPQALQHSKTSENKDNSLKVAERVIATTKSVNETLNEKLKVSEALARKYEFLCHEKEKELKRLRYNRKEDVNAFNRFKAEYDEMKKRAEIAEAKAVDFDRRVDAVKMERDSTVRSYRQFLKLNKMLESYDILKKPLDLSEEVANDSGKQ